MPNSRLERLSIVFLLLFAAALDTVGIGFYLPRHYDPCIDSIHPAIALDAFQHAFSERHAAGLKYPRLHLIVTGALDRVVLAAIDGPDGGSRVAHELVDRLRTVDPGQGMLGIRDRFRPWTKELSYLILVGRLLSAAMGVLLVFAMFLLAREIAGVLEGFVTAFATAVAYPIVYYAHTLNVDVSYLCLGAFALAFAYAAANRRCGRRLVLASILAALSIATKDQAYGWFVLTIPFVLLRWMRRDGGAAPPFPTKAVLGSLLIGAGVYAIALGLPFDVAGVKAHFSHILGSGSEAYQLYPKSIAGEMQLAHEVGLHLVDAMGWPLLLFAALGCVALAIRNRPALFAIAIPALSYDLTFLAPIRYTYQRFTLPISLMLTIAAATGLCLLLRHRYLRLPGILIVFVLLGERAQRAIEVDAMLLDDPQGRAAAYLEQSIPSGAHLLAGLQFPLSNVELPAHAAVTLSATGSLPLLSAGDMPPRFIVLASYDSLRTALEPDPGVVGMPGSMRQYVSDYDRIALFSPLYDHPLRHGAAFQPTIGVYELRGAK